MKDSIITIRIDEKTKEIFEGICKDSGLTTSSVLTAMINNVVKQGKMSGFMFNSGMPVYIDTGVFKSIIEEDKKMFHFNCFSPLRTFAIYNWYNKFLMANHEGKIIVRLDMSPDFIRGKLKGNEWPEWFIDAGINGLYDMTGRHYEQQAVSWVLQEPDDIFIEIINTEKDMEDRDLDHIPDNIIGLRDINDMIIKNRMIIQYENGDEYHYLTPKEIDYQIKRFMKEHPELKVKRITEKEFRSLESQFYEIYQKEEESDE